MKELQFYLDYTISSVAYHKLLQYSPDGWSESIIKRVRSDVYFGLTQQFTTQLTFVKDGALILKQLFYSNSFEVDCTLTIKQLVNATMTYTTIFTGKVDFSTFVDEYVKVKVNINEENFLTKLKANEDTEYDIDMVYPLQVQCDFPYIQESIVVNSEMKGEEYIGLSILGFYEIEKETLLNSVQSFDNLPALNQTIPNAQPTFRIFNTIQDTNIIIQGKIQVSIPSVRMGAVVTFILMLDNTIIGAIGTANFTDGTILKSISFNINTTIPSFTNISQTLSIVANYQEYGINQTYNYYILGDLYWRLSYNTYPETKYINAITPLMLLDELLKKINDGVAVTIDDTWLNEIENYVLTTGDAVRGLLGAKIKTTFKEFFNSFNSIFGIGFSYRNGVAQLYTKSYFYDNTSEIANIGEVSNLTVNIYKNHIINSLKIGYEDRQTDNVNAKYEYNSTNSFNLPIKKIVKQGEMISKYRADVFGIMTTSLNLEGKTTTDSKNDNDTFILHIKWKVDDDYWELERDYNYTSNFTDVNKAFNVKLSPKRMLFNNGSFINSFLHKLPGTSLIKFTSGLRNYDFFSNYTDEGGSDIYEGISEQISVLDNPLFQPYIFEFDVIIPKDYNALISSNENGYITFKWKGLEYKGFIDTIDVNPSKNTTYRMKLISHPENDLTHLING